MAPARVASFIHFQQGDTLRALREYFIPIDGWITIHHFVKVRTQGRGMRGVATGCLRSRSRQAFRNTFALKTAPKTIYYDPGAKIIRVAF
jgi:hypothetical protein